MQISVFLTTNYTLGSGAATSTQATVNRFRASGHLRQFVARQRVARQHVARRRDARRRAAFQFPAEHLTSSPFEPTALYDDGSSPKASKAGGCRGCVGKSLQSLAKPNALRQA